MATLTSSGSGDFSNSSTWGGTTPASGDYFIISTGHNVTLSTDFIIGDSPLSASTYVLTCNGTLTVNSNATLTLRGSAVCHGTTGTNGLLQFNGTNLVFDGTVNSVKYKLDLGTAHSTTAKVVFAGTSGDRCSVSSLGSGSTNGYIGGTSFIGSGRVEADYTDFSQIGDSTNSAIQFWISTSSSHNLYLRNCTFTSCGKIYNSVAFGNVANFIVDNVIFKNGVGTFSLDINSSAPTTGARTINYFRCDKQAKMVCTSLNITNCFFGGGISFTSRNLLASFQNNLINGDALCPTIVDECYFTDTSTNTNTHSLQFDTTVSTTQNITNNVFDTPAGTDGDHMIGGVATITYNIKNNILVPNASGNASGKILSLVGGNGNFVFENNTYGTSGFPGININQAASWGETHPGTTGMISSCKSNLVYKLAGNTAVLARANQNLTGNPVLNNGSCDYNGMQDPVTATGSGVNFVCGSKGGYVDTVASNPTVRAYSSSTITSGNFTILCEGSVAGGGTAETSQLAYNASSATVLSALTTALNSLGDGTYALTGVSNAAANSGTGTSMSITRNGVAIAEEHKYRIFRPGSVNTMNNGGLVGTTRSAFETYDTIGVNDVVGSPNFVDTTRNFATFDSAYLGNSRTAWANGVSYNVGDYVSAQSSSFYNNAVVNYRCILAHTSNSGNATNGKPGDSATTGWRTNWQFASYWSLLDTASTYSSGSTNSTVKDLCSWVRTGFKPQNTVFRNASHSGTTIGAVEGQFTPATYTSSQSGNSSSASTWGGAGVPADGDRIVISNGHTVAVDKNLTVGNNSSSIGHAVTINGASAASYGTLVVNDGVTLTLKGNDRTSNTAMLINRYGKFIPQPGSTILVDCASDAQTFIDNRGYILAQGTSNKKITFGIPSSRANWNTTVASDVRPTTGRWDWTRGIYCIRLSNPWVSNAAGTGIGSRGDSSLSFSSVLPSGVLTNEVSSPDDVVNTGDYFVDYQLGYVWIKSASGPSFTASYKRLSYTSWTINSIQNTGDHEAVFEYCDFNMIGTKISNTLWALSFQHKQSASVAANRRAKVTNCTFNYCSRALGLRNLTGTALDPILIEDNTFISPDGESGYGWLVANLWTANSYVNFKRNKIKIREYAMSFSGLTTPCAQTGWSIKDNVIYGASTFIYSRMNAVTFPSTVIEDNFHYGPSAAQDGRSISAMNGISGNNVIIRDNFLLRTHRGINYAPYTEISGNIIKHSYHHGINSPAVETNTHIPGVSIKNNIFLNDGGGDGAHIELGYNKYTFTDAPVVEHNTMIDNSGQGGFSWGDLGDNFGSHLTTNGVFRSNLITGNAAGIRRPTDSTTNRTVPGVAACDWNSLFDNTSDYQNYNRQGTFKVGSTDYNLNSGRNLTGVTLHNPSYSTAQSGRQLSLTVNTIDSNVTISWGGGTAVQLVWGTGTATAGANTSELGISGLLSGTITDSSKSWSTLLNNSGSPTGKWIKITGGTGSGQIRRITSNTATVLTVVPSWTTIPNGTSTYAIYEGEARVYDSSGTQYVDACIDLREMPTTSQSDSNISIAFNSIAENPSYSDSTRSISTWDSYLGGSGKEYSGFLRIWANPTLVSDLVEYIKTGFSPTNAVYSTGGHDGETIGAMSYQSIASPSTDTSIIGLNIGTDMFLVGSSDGTFLE